MRKYYLVGIVKFKSRLNEVHHFFIAMADILPSGLLNSILRFINKGLRVIIKS